MLCSFSGEGGPFVEPANTGTGTREFVVNHT